MNYAEEAPSRFCPAGSSILKNPTAVVSAVGSKNKAMKNNICSWCKWEIGQTSYLSGEPIFLFVFLLSM